MPTPIEPITGRKLFDAHRHALEERYDPKMLPRGWDAQTDATKNVWILAAKFVNNHFVPQYDLLAAQYDAACRHIDRR